MVISVASGKGGTGKTTVTASLVAVWDEPVMAVDLDVEAPNLHLFLTPDFVDEETVGIEIPVVDTSRCTLCGICSDFCQFKAIALMGEMVLTFPEMCHGCGGCIELCPENALSKGSRDLGTIRNGRAGDSAFMMGSLRIGEAMSPPLMREVKKRVAARVEQNPCDVIIDAPPGVSCPAIAAVMDSDLILLIAEPTPFGFYDFKLAIEAFAPIGKPMAVVINRAGTGNDALKDFCREKNLPVVAEIPWARDIAEGYSQGRIIASLNDALETTFLNLREKLQQYRTSRVAHV